MAKRRQFPVEHRDDARLGRMDDRVADAIVAMNDCCLIARRQVCREPGDQAIHFLILVGLRREVLPCPAIELPRDVAFGLSKVAETAGAIIDAVKIGRDTRVVGVNRPTLCGTQLRQGHAGDDASVDMIHHIERRADNTGVLTQESRFRRRRIGLRKRAKNPVFTFDQVRRGQKFAGRLLAQNVLLRRSVDQIGWIRLPALKLLQRRRPAKIVEVRLQVAP